MYRVATAELRPGMRLGKSIVAGDGRILLHGGTELKEAYIKTLQKLGIPAVYITNDLAPDVEPKDVVSDQTRQALTTQMGHAVADIQQTFRFSAKTTQRRFTTGFDASKLKLGVDLVVTDLLSNPRAVVNLQDIRTADEYTLGHSVNVCILCTLMGLSLGYNVNQLNELGMGALMHDIGKTMIPKEVLNKTTPLTPEEFAQIKEHPTFGWKILSNQPEISYLSSAVALQHHERWAGGGYPRSIKGKEIHEYARICGVVDCYDAMVADRPYRKGFTPARALKTMTELTKDYFDPEMLSVFQECIAIYPVGALVRVTGGYVAIVAAVERGKTERPRIRLIRDPRGIPMTRQVELDLGVHKEIEILEVLQEESTEFAIDALN